MSSFVEQFDQLFTGCREVYAEGYPDPEKAGKQRYALRERPLTHEVFRQHFTGSEFIGMYQMMPDSLVGWFLIDHDAPKNVDGSAVDDPWPIVWADAQAQIDAFARAGLFTYAERSRSGKGIHVWGFLDRPVPAAMVRDAIWQHVLPSVSKERWYPVQDAITPGKPYGNLIGLPFHGPSVAEANTLFLDDQGTVIPPRDFFAAVQRNATGLIEQLARKGGRPKVRSVSSRRQQAKENGKLLYGTGDPTLPDEGTERGALKVLSPFGCKFMRHCWEDRKRLPEPMWYGMIQQCTHFEHGRNLAHLMSKDYPGYNPAQVDEKYDQALRNPRIGCQYIHESWPELACEHCPTARDGTLLAPHCLGKQDLATLVKSSRVPMERAGSFKEDLERVARYDSGEVQAGVKWGLEGLDDYVRFRKREVTVVGGMPSLGKTWIMLDVAYRLAHAGVPVFIFSAETGRESLRMRLLARAAEVDSMALRGERKGLRLTRDEKHRLESASEMLTDLQIYMDFQSLTADDVLAQVEECLLRERIPLDAEYVIWFDFLQFGSTMTTEEQTEYTRLSRLSSDFKLVAKTLDRAVCVFSQLKRENEGNETPQINWFKGTGRIETDMDVGIIITGERMAGRSAPRSLTIVKQREGIANVKLDYTLQQSFGRWDYVGAGQQPTETEGPLFENQPDPLEEV